MMIVRLSGHPLVQDSLTMLAHMPEYFHKFLPSTFEKLKCALAVHRRTGYDNNTKPEFYNQGCKAIKYEIYHTCDIESHHWFTNLRSKGDNPNVKC